MRSSDLQTNADDATKDLATYLYENLKAKLTAHQRDQRRRFLQNILSPGWLSTYLDWIQCPEKELCESFRLLRRKRGEVSYLERSEAKANLQRAVDSLAKLSNDHMDETQYRSGLKNYGAAQGTTRKPKGNRAGGAHL